MKVKDISAFEQLNKLKMNVFELSPTDKTFSPGYFNENYCEEHIDLILYENAYCLVTN